MFYRETGVYEHKLQSSPGTFIHFRNPTLQDKNVDIVFEGFYSCAPMTLVDGTIVLSSASWKLENTR